MEYALAKVEKDYRIHIPKALLSNVGWGPDDGAGACVLLGSSGRCRLLAGGKLQNDPDCQKLQQEIDAASEEPLTSLLDFRDESRTVLPLRLLPVDVAPHGANYRMTLPKLLTSIFQVRPGEESVAVLVNQGHIEIWSFEALRTAITPPLQQLLLD